MFSFKAAFETLASQIGLADANFLAFACPFEELIKIFL